MEFFGNFTNDKVVNTTTTSSNMRIRFVIFGRLLGMVALLLGANIKMSKGIPLASCARNNFRNLLRFLPSSWPCIQCTVLHKCMDFFYDPIGFEININGIV